MPSDHPDKSKRVSRTPPLDADGHRGRMMTRFFKTIDYDLDERETLEMLLYYSIPRADTRDTAIRLIKRFGSLDRVLHSEEHHLTAADGIGSKSAAFLRLMGEAADRIDTPLDPPQPEYYDKTTDEIIDLFREQMAGTADVPSTWIAAFDTCMRLRRMQQLCPGAITSSPQHLRLVMDFTFATDASAIVLARASRGQFNMPSGSDLTTARHIHEGLYIIGRTLYDYVVINEGGGFSVRPYMLL